MKNYFAKGVLAAIFAVVLAAPAAAQDNASVGVGGDSEGAAGVIFRDFRAATVHFAARYQCTDPSFTSSTIAASVADLEANGDLWRVTIWKGTKNTKFGHTANSANAAGGTGVFPVGFFGPDAGFGNAVKKIDVLVTAGNNIPAGTPATGRLRITTNAGNAVCTPKQFRNAVFV